MGVQVLGCFLFFVFIYLKRLNHRSDLCRGVRLHFFPSVDHFELGGIYVEFRWRRRVSNRGINGLGDSLSDGRIEWRRDGWRIGATILTKLKIFLLKDREHVEESEDYSFAFHENLAVPMIHQIVSRIL